MSTPTKPPRQPRQKQYKDESSSGFLVTVIKTLEFSETAEERQNEKLKIEKEFKKADNRLNELVSKHDKELTKVLPLFSQVSGQITSSRDKIHTTKANLVACKQLLQCRRDELKKLWCDAVQQKYVLEYLETINELRKVPVKVLAFSSKRQYLHATKVLTDAISTAENKLLSVEGLSDLRSDMQVRKDQLYTRLHEELSKQLYRNSTAEIMKTFQRQNSSRLNGSNSNFQRNFARRSTDRAEANAKVRKALIEMSQGFDLKTSEAVEDADLIDPDLSMTYFISIIVECFAMMKKVPESIDEIKCKIQSELLEIVQITTAQMISLNISSLDKEKHPVLCLLEIIFKQFRVVAQTHALLLKNYLIVLQKYSISTNMYDLGDFWQQAQQVLQLVLKDYLDIEHTQQDEIDQGAFNDSAPSLAFYFSRRKIQPKKNLFKFDKCSTSPTDYSSGHRRNPSNASMDEVLDGPGGSGRFKSKKKQEKTLVCEPDQAIITKIYLRLLAFIQEIESYSKCKGQPCSLQEFIANFIKESFLSKGHNRNLQMTIESLSKNQDAWRSITNPEEMKSLNLVRPLLQSTVLVERRITETKTLIQDLPNYSEDLLKMVCALLKTYRETCQAAYRGIVQPDSEDKRIYSVAWLKDEDISRFLKTLPNWTDLKFSRAKQNNRGKLQRSHYEPSEEESPTQVQQRNIREAEMLTSNLGEGGISQQEILSDITILKELAILQESMEWFSSRISEFANDLRRPMNGLNTNGNSEYLPVTIQDGTIKVLTNLALEFDELANTCLLVLHLEVRVQCFHYLRTKPKPRGNSFMDKGDSSEPDTQVLKLTKVLQEMDDAFSTTLHPRKTRVCAFIFIFLFFKLIMKPIFHSIYSKALHI
ncbi:EXOC4 family protein [Megaselia abdita]